jgi:CRISPR-associated protein Cas2
MSRLRRRYLVSYDIADDKRRNQVFKLLLAEGDHVQFSVFLCDLNQREYVALRGSLEETINQSHDQILIIDLGAADRLPDTFLLTIGLAYSPSGPVVVV